MGKMCALTNIAITTTLSESVKLESVKTIDLNQMSITDFTVYSNYVEFLALPGRRRKISRLL